MAASRNTHPSRTQTNYELLKQLTIRNVAESIRGSALGLPWLVLNPLLSLALYVLVFGVLFEGSFGAIENESPINYAIGIFIGLTMVSLINDTIGRSTNLMGSHRNYVRKVVFPVVLLPVSQVLASTFKYAVNGCLWLLAGIAFGSVLRWEVVYLLPVILPMVGFSLGLALLISSVSVYFKDAQQLTNVLTQLVFWSSGVFFSAHKVKAVPELWAFLKWNPVLLAIDNIRAVAIWGTVPDWSQVLLLYGYAAGALLAGAFVFHRLKDGFSDYL